jgi:inner membrane protein
MHPATHILAGWCFGNTLRLTAKERALCIAASILPDIDGLGLFAGVETYQRYHHVLAHNLTFCTLATLATLWQTRCSIKAAAVFFALFHLHLLMDLFGSGPGWGIAYLWPWSEHTVYSAHAWSFFGWQNYTAFLFFAVWTLIITRVYRRTPVEFVAPRLDAFALTALPKTKINPRNP